MWQRTDSSEHTVTFTREGMGAVPSRTEAVLEAIRHAIVSGALPPGRALVESDLASQLGVSKTPVREALKTLAGAGLVTMSPYKGAVVRAIGDADARHVYDLRMLLEPEALRRSAAAGRDWSAARYALERATAAQGLAERSMANRDFHHELYAGCGNPMLVELLDGLRDQTALVSAAAWRQGDSWQTEADEHRAILAAVAAGDPRVAADLLRSHIVDFVARNFTDRTETTR